MDWIVGQDPDCDVVVNDEYASSRHCMVRRQDEDGRFFVADIGSTNGTYLVPPEGQRVKVTAWTEWLPGFTLIVGRSRIPRPIH